MLIGRLVCLSFTFCILVDDDVSRVQVCTMSSSLILQTYNNQTLDGHSFSIAAGCERKLVTTCDSDTQLEIRVDFLKNDFSSTKVAILYKGESIIIDEELNLIPSASTFADIIHHLATNMVSVSIPEIELTIERTFTALTISFDNPPSLPLAGLCGNLDGQLLLPDCTSTVDVGRDLDSFIKTYKLKPSDQILREERMECGEYNLQTCKPCLTLSVHTPCFRCYRQ